MTKYTTHEKHNIKRMADKGTQMKFGVNKSAAISPDLKTRVGDWIFKSTFPEVAPIKLNQRRIFILPTRAGLMLGITLLLMLIGSINYNLSLGYVLTFLAAATAVVSILHTFRNLVRLELDNGKTQEIYAGEEAKFAIVIHNPLLFSRYSIGLRYQKNDATYADLTPKQNTIVYLPVVAHKRGWLILERLNIFTQYPMGIFNAWSNVGLDLRCLVYPKPDYTHPLPDLGLSPFKEGSQQVGGTDDFAGLRSYQPGDSPKHIAWKTVAREQEVMTKQFSGAGHRELWLEWDQLPAMDIEARLSRLCGWVLQADKNQLRYGLRLPNLVIAPDIGDPHKKMCLEALALFGQVAQ
jgi:uncharacterized protein (DUF58 family)